MNPSTAGSALVSDEEIERNKFGKSRLSKSSQDLLEALNDSYLIFHFDSKVAGACAS